MSRRTSPRDWVANFNLLTLCRFGELRLTRLRASLAALPCSVIHGCRIGLSWMQTCGRHHYESTTINYSISSEWTRRAQWTQGMAGCRLFHCTRKSTFHPSPRPQMHLGIVLGSLSTLLPSSSPSSSSHMACPFDVRASSHRVPLKTLRVRQPVPNRTKPVSCRLKHILVRHYLGLFLPVRGCF